MLGSVRTFLRLPVIKIPKIFIFLSHLKKSWLDLNNYLNYQSYSLVNACHHHHHHNETVGKKSLKYVGTVATRV